MSNKSNRGQAVVEYLLLFAFMTMISIALVRSFTETIGETAGGLTVTLTNQLTTGVCKKDCYFTGFSNQ